MKTDVAKTPLADRFEHLFKVISGPRFLRKQGLGNEVPFFICPFKPEEAVAMEKIQCTLINRLKQRGVQILSINLYDLSIEILKERGIWEQVIEMEKSVSKEKLKELLQGVLDPESHLIPAIASKMANADFEVLFFPALVRSTPTFALTTY